ncbi:MAG: OmpA family protein [Cyclobacteriaceae bacterium]|jgi:OOP family OmpA-OmpF porin|nr:OmpA family protein [Cyclobacteriaceae bacterium]
MKKLILVLILIIIAERYAFTQTADANLVWAEGKIIHAVTKQPVEAKIIYQSLPYGNRVGSLSGSNYNFPFLDGEKYAIMVQAEGFEPIKLLLDPAEANADKKVVKDIELTEGKVPEKHPVGHVMRLDNLIFDQGKARISPESYPELDVLVDMLSTHRGMVIQLEGHTDYLGPAKQNMDLSEKRVNAVKNYLISKGVHKNRVKTKAFGGTKPLSMQDTPEAHAANRRVEVRVLQN